MPEFSHVQVPPNSTGVMLRTIYNPGVASGAHQEIVTLADDAGVLVSPLTDVQLRANPVPVSGSVSVLNFPASVAVSNFPATQAVSSSSIDALLADIKRGVTDYEIRFDYGARADGNPERVGKAPQGTATGANTWVIQTFSYDASNRPTRIQVTTGVWA